jgi:hypothetical protein
MLSFQTTTFLLSCGLLLGACKNLSVNRNPSGYIIGANSIGKASESSNKSNYNLDAFVLIATLTKNNTVKKCSGTIIKHNNIFKVLTNHHCFAKSKDGATASLTLEENACVKTTVFANLNPNHKEHLVYSCRKDSLKTNKAADIAVFTLDAPEDSELQYLELSDADVQVKDQEAYVVHYPDIRENQIKLPNTPYLVPLMAITDEECQVQDRFPENEWTLDESLQYAVKHTCDIVDGSSGSALVMKETNKLIGLNWGGIIIQYKDRSLKTNTATHVSFVHMFLNGELSNQMSSRGMADASTDISAKKKSQSKSEKKPNFCGTLGSKGVNQLFLASLLLLPLLAPTFRRFKSIKNMIK